MGDVCACLFHYTKCMLEKHSGGMCGEDGGDGGADAGLQPV